MPELPEVETVARQLAPWATGRSIARLRFHDSRLRVGRTPTVKGRTIRDVRRIGKQVVLELGPAKADNRPLWLAVHLRMTGILLWSPDGPDATRPYLRATIELKPPGSGAVLFVDTRRFGTFRWYRDPSRILGSAVDPLSEELTVARMRKLLQGSRQNLKAWLLRQDRLVGLGNIYAAEILHDCELSPLRHGDSLDANETRRLRTATRKILRRAIRNCGTTFSDFQDARGVEGSYQQFLAVYGREGQPCPRCGEPILRIVQQQRSTFYCAGCQC